MTDPVAPTETSPAPKDRPQDRFGWVDGDRLVIVSRADSNEPPIDFSPTRPDELDLPTS